MASVIGVIAPLFALSYLASQLFSILKGVPYVPANRRAINNILSFADLKKTDILYDLGSGDGRILIGAVKDFGVQRCVGYEIAPWPYLKSKLAIFYQRLGKEIRIIRKSYLKADVSDATIICVYLLPKALNQLLGTLNLKENSRLLSLQFPISNHDDFDMDFIRSGSYLNTDFYLYKKGEDRHGRSLVFNPPSIVR